MAPSNWQQARAYVERLRGDGRTGEEIRQALLNTGWSAEQVAELLSREVRRAPTPPPPPTPSAPARPPPPTPSAPARPSPATPSTPAARPATDPAVLSGIVALVVLVVVILLVRAAVHPPVAGPTGQPASEAPVVELVSEDDEAPLDDAPADRPDGGSSATGGTISHGQQVDLADHVVAGKITIFDFYSDYCPPCRTISPRLEELAGKRDDIAVVKVDINRPGVRGIDWQSPVARQHSLRSIPHFVIYGANGQVMAQGRSAAEQVYGWLGE